MKLNTLLLVAEAIDTLATNLPLCVYTTRFIKDPSVHIHLERENIINALEKDNLLSVEDYTQLREYFQD